MKIKLKKKETIDGLYTEEQLSDLPLIESIYNIRILKALAESLEVGYIEATHENNCGQAYSEKYQIWLSYYDVVN